MDKASVYGTGDCRFESYRGHLTHFMQDLGCYDPLFAPAHLVCATANVAFWSRGMILRLGRRGPGFEPRKGPFSARLRHLVDGDV
jgi:hypothetical protein